MMRWNVICPKMAKKEIIEFKPIEPRTVEITIQGDTDLILNKMNDVTTRQLTDARKDKAKDLAKPNEWEQIVTSIHWLNGKPKKFSEEVLKIDDLGETKKVTTDEDEYEARAVILATGSIDKKLGL